MTEDIPVDEDQEILGSEFCSGYTDILGKWNSGFYCPSGDSTEALFCCGTSTYKYCCTRREQGAPREYIASLPLLIGVIFVVVAAIGIVTILILAVFCVCSCCSLYKKRQPRIEAGPLYRLQCSSTASGVANMYSFSTQNSMATTPIDSELTRNNLLVELEACNGGMSPGNRNNGRTTMSRGNTFSSDTPPLPVKQKSVGFEPGCGGEEDDDMPEDPRNRQLFSVQSQFLMQETISSPMTEGVMQMSSSRQSFVSQGPARGSVASETLRPLQAPSRGSVASETLRPLQVPSRGSVASETLRPLQAPSRGSVASETLRPLQAPSRGSVASETLRPLQAPSRGSPASETVRPLADDGLYRSTKF